MTTEGLEGYVHCDHPEAVETSKAENTNSDVCKGDFFTGVNLVQAIGFERLLEAGIPPEGCASATQVLTVVNVFRAGIRRRSLPEDCEESVSLLFAMPRKIFDRTEISYFPCLAANSTSPFSVSAGTWLMFPIFRPLIKSVGVLLTSALLPSAKEASTRALVSGFAAQAAMSAPFTPAASASAVSFSSALSAVMSACVS